MTEPIFTNVNFIEEMAGKLILLAFIVSMVAGCAWENEETLFPESDLCDTLDVSYSGDVDPITNHCYTCHSNSNAPDFAQGIAFEDYEDASSYASTIVGAINHLQGFLAYAQGGR